MKIALAVACLLGVLLIGSAETRAQGIAVGIGVPTYPAPIYSAPIYPTTVYSIPAYTGYAPAYYSQPVYYSAPAYYSSPVTVYAPPVAYAAPAPIVAGAPVLVHGHWGRHHAHLHYRW